MILIVYVVTNVTKIGRDYSVGKKLQFAISLFAFAISQCKWIPRWRAF